ncbi:MAG: hypothetical protein QOF72_813 [Blastocatellia bacterium]|nr:hypothetical protein [Blastocatellia bacterium]
MKRSHEACRLFPDGNPVRMTPEAARKLTEGAVSYAKGFGFSPAADYKKASRVFGGITAAKCDEQFVFGKNGKPLYAQGLLESPACVERILRALEARCGEGGYDYILAADNFELFDGEDQNVKTPRPIQSFEQGSSGWPKDSAPVNPARRLGSIRLVSEEFPT